MILAATGLGLVAHVPGEAESLEWRDFFLPTDISIWEIYAPHQANAAMRKA